MGNAGRPARMSKSEAEAFIEEAHSRGVYSHAEFKKLLYSYWICSGEKMEYVANKVGVTTASFEHYINYEAPASPQRYIPETMLDNYIEFLRSEKILDHDKAQWLRDVARDGGFISRKSGFDRQNGHTPRSNNPRRSSAPNVPDENPSRSRRARPLAMLSGIEFLPFLAVEDMADWGMIAALPTPIISVAGDRNNPISFRVG